MRAAIFAEENRKWWTLGAVAFGLFMIMLDNTVVFVALSSIQSDLHISQSELEWVVNGYALTFAVLMLTGGKLADMLGRRLIFIIGLTIFTASSLACGLATGASFLIGARVVQGVGAALMNPATLSIITATFPPRQRGTAIGIWVGVSAMALAIGPLIGGILTEQINWSWIFFINVPVGIAGVIVSRLFIDETRDESKEQRLDLPGLITSAVGLFGLTYALIEGNNYGWGSTRILASFAVAAVGLVTFVMLEHRQRVPMLDLSLFKNSTFAGANTTMLLVALAMFGVFFFNSLYLGQVLGYSPIQTGATFLPLTVLIVFVAPLAGRFSDKIGSRWLMGAGLVLLSSSLLAFSTLGVNSTFWDIVPGLILGGFGMSLAMTPTTAAAMGSVPVDKAGVGSAVLNSMRQVGGSLGIALMGAIVASSVSVLPGSPDYPAQFVEGYHNALHVAAAIALLGAVVAVATVRKVHHPEAEAEARPALEGA
jgi:EmrB/QacA subfamily drug resistance transporter